MTVKARLVGGPLAGHIVDVSGRHFGDVIELTTKRDTAGTVGLETKAHYEIAPDVLSRKKEVVGNWVNPADRRQYGR